MRHQRFFVRWVVGLVYLLTAYPGVVVLAQQTIESNRGGNLFSQIGWTRSAPVPALPSTAESSQPRTEPASANSDTRQFFSSIDQPPVISASAEGSSLSLGELESMALATNPAIAEAAARVEAAQGAWLQSGLGPNPEIGYSGQQLGSGGIAEQHGFFLGKTFIRGGKLDLNRAVECEEIHRLNAAWSLQHQRVITDVRGAFYQVLAAQKKLALARQLAEINSQALRAAESLVRIKEGSKVDVLQAEIELEAVTATLHQSEFECAAAWRQLATIIGQPELAMQSLSGDLETEQMPINFEDAWQNLIVQSPELQMAEIALEKASRMLQRQRAESVPDLNVEAVVQHDNATDDINGNLQVTFPLRLVNRNQGGIQEAAARLNEARQALERKKLELRGKLSAAFVQYETARDQASHYRESILPKAAENLELVRRGYEAGEFSFIQVLTVQRTYSEKNSIYLTALRELWTRKLEIEGLLLNDSLGDF